MMMFASPDIVPLIGLTVTGATATLIGFASVAASCDRSRVDFTGAGAAGMATGGKLHDGAMIGLAASRCPAP